MGLERSIELPYVWERLHFALSMAGLKINSIPVNSWRLEDKQLVFITSGNKKITKDFDKVICFDEEIKEFSVYDWFQVKSGKMHDLDFVYGDSKFVNKLIFHTPRDPKSYKRGKDVVAVSYLSEEDLENINYSPGIARLKAAIMMKESGIRGRRNGFLNKEKGTHRHYALKIEHSYREVKLKIESLYSLDEIMTMEQAKGKAWNTLKSLLYQYQPSI